MLDVGLPEVSGYEVCRELRDDYGSEVGIIFVSRERTTPADRVAGLLVGADDYIVKPFATMSCLRGPAGFFDASSDRRGVPRNLRREWSVPC